MYHGMLTVYKEKGYTSSDAVARLRGILQMRKIGHTGTLDPDAEGVLPMCLGNATRICELIADKEKEYAAVMRLGVRTDTQDMAGEVLEKMEEAEILPCILKNGAPSSANEGNALSERLNADGGKFVEVPSSANEINAFSLAETRIRAAAASFVGEIDQIPPMYSAIKVNGRRLYDMARKGITVERKPRRITIHELRVEKIELPLVAIRVRCSRGTYIRTLCEDIGDALGTGAAMQSLLRTRVGSFTLDEALTLDEWERIAKTEPERLSSLIRPVDSFFGSLPAIVCAEESLRLLKNGNPLSEGQYAFLRPQTDPDSPGAAPGGGEPEAVRVYDGRGVFYGLYRKKEEGGSYAAWKMFLPEEKS